MSATTLEIIDTNLEKTQSWLKEIREELHTDDSHEAYQALRAVIHAVRDRLPVEEAADLAAQLPLLVKGIYFDGWRPAGKPEKIRSDEEFLSKVQSSLKVSGPTNPERYVRAVLAVLNRHVSSGELEQVRASLPQRIQRLWPEMQPA